MKPFSENELDGADLIGIGVIVLSFLTAVVVGLS